MLSKNINILTSILVFSVLSLCTHLLLAQVVNVTTYAGTSQGYKDGPRLTTEQFDFSFGIAVDPRDNSIYIADFGNHRIRKISPDGEVTTYAGNGVGGGFVDGARNVARFKYPYGVAVDNAGNVYVTDQGNYRIRKIATNGNVTTFAGTGDIEPNNTVVDGPGSTAKFRELKGIVYDSVNNLLYVTDSQEIRSIKLTGDSLVATLAGQYSDGNNDGTGTSAKFRQPNGLTVDASGNVYIADRGNHKVRRMTVSGSVYAVTTFAGSGNRGFQDGISTEAKFDLPGGVAFDGYGNFYVADPSNHRIRKVSPNGTVSTFAGSSTSGYSDGDVANAKFNKPVAIALDNNGDLLIVDSGNFRIRKIGLNTPGGVNNLALWLRADDGVTENTVPTVTEWKDFSGNNRHADQRFGVTKKSSTPNNFHPSILFEGSSFLSFSASPFLSGFTKAEVFSVLKITNNAYNQTNGHPLFFRNSGGKNNYYNDANQNISTDFFTDDQASFNPETNAIEGGTNKAGLIVEGKPVNIRNWNIYGSHSEISNWGVHFNGFLKAKTINNTFKVSLQNSFERIGANQNGTTTDFFEGEISEIILFDRVLSIAERAKINSYLAVKYGITLSNEAGGVAGDYVASDNKVIWDASAATNTYHKNVIGIGRDDSQDLYQKQSHTDNHTTVLYIGSHASNNSANTGSFPSDLQYVIMGDNGGKLCATSSSYLEKPTGIVTRLEREWRVTNTNFTNTGLNLKIKLNSCANTTNINSNHLRLLVDDDGDFSDATAYPSVSGGLSVTYNNGVIQISNIQNTHIPKNSTKYITIGSSDPNTPLPIELKDFKATVTDNEKVILNWQTASETNSDYYVVHKSKNSKEWTEVAKLPAAGNSTTEKKYKHTDHSPYLGTSYYRLTQVDRDGTSTNFPLVAVNITSSDYIPLKLFPNPVTDRLTITGNPDEISTLKIVDVLGNDVSSSTNIFYHNDYKAIISLHNLPNGMYFLMTKTSSNKIFKN